MIFTTAKKIALSVVGLSVVLAAGATLASKPDPTPVLNAETIELYKSPTCGCCSKWVDHMREAGFEVAVHDVADMASVKRRGQVPEDLYSCHTGFVGDYVLEGHIPARVVREFLDEAPDLAGLAVPGMPIGSPGMEGRNSLPYNVIAFDEEGNRGVRERITP